MQQMRKKKEKVAPYKKINISMPGPLLDLFDERCDSLGFGKSKLFQLWVINFLETTDGLSRMGRIGEYPPTQSGIAESTSSTQAKL